MKYNDEIFCKNFVIISAKVFEKQQRYNAKMSFQRYWIILHAVMLLNILN